MVDISASMLRETSGGQTKWSAVRGAVEGFLADEASSGIGVGIQYFPHHKPDVPFECSATAECGAGGPCVQLYPDSVCVQIRGEPDPNRGLPFCINNRNCQADSVCAPWGTCAVDSSLLCLFPGEDSGPGCGICQQPLLGSCVDKPICEQSEYSTPAVPIAALPGNAQALMSSLTTTNPEPPGAYQETNSGVALSAALEHASAHKASNSEHAVAVVLVTDGLPNYCFGFPVDTDQDVARAVQAVASAASAGLAGAGGIRTFVIGVVDAPSPGEPLQAGPLLDQVAAAGGTERAFIVDAAGSVSGEFASALTAIRGTLACDYQLPPAPPNERLDYFKINVGVTLPGSPRQDLLYVGAQRACDPATGGWYYDADPTQGQTPTRVIVCDQSCAQFKSVPNAEVNLQVGCVTRQAEVR
jgi:hypothetical protein